MTSPLPTPASLTEALAKLPRLAQALTGHDTVKICEDIKARSDAYDAAVAEVISLFSAQQARIEELEGEIEDRAGTEKSLLEWNESLAAELALLRETALTPAEKVWILEGKYDVGCTMCLYCDDIRAKLSRLATQDQDSKADG